MKRLSVGGKILTAISGGGIVALAVFLFYTRDMSEIAVPRWLSLPLIISLALTVLCLLVSAVTECVLVCRENEYGIRALRPVIISFVVFYLLFLIYNYFTDPAHIHYLPWLYTSLLITVGSCTLNFWKRKWK